MNYNTFCHAVAAVNEVLEKEARRPITMKMENAAMDNTDLADAMAWKAAIEKQKADPKPVMRRPGAVLESGERRPSITVAYGRTKEESNAQMDKALGRKPGTTMANIEMQTNPAQKITTIPRKR